MLLKNSACQTILEHGLSVADRYDDLLRMLDGLEPVMPWRLPSWLNQGMLSRVEKGPRVRTYHVFHDCGKPLCLRIDDAGRQHFPDHAPVSASLWRSLGGDESIAWYIEHDMDMHVLRRADIAPLVEDPRYLTLLVTALCEIHSNADLFGGTGSDSFKIKWKRLNRIGGCL